MSLHDDLLDECDRHQFLPSDLLQQLVTKERIESHLVSHDIFLAAAILEKILDKGRKLFALLVLLSRETIVDVVFKCFHDDMLPFATIEDVPKEVGDERRRRQFLHFQRSFFPKLTCEDPPQEYSRSPTLPIAQHIQEQGHGSFGVIHKVKIVRGYIDGFHLVRSKLSLPDGKKLIKLKKSMKNRHGWHGRKYKRRRNKSGTTY